MLTVSGVHIRLPEVVHAIESRGFECDICGDVASYEGDLVYLCDCCLALLEDNLLLQATKLLLEWYDGIDIDEMDVGVLLRKIAKVMRSYDD